MDTFSLDHNYVSIRKTVVMDCWVFLTNLLTNLVSRAKLKKLKFYLLVHWKRYNFIFLIATLKCTCLAETLFLHELPKSQIYSKNAIPFLTDLHTKIYWSFKTNLFVFHKEPPQLFKVGEVSKKGEGHEIFYKNEGVEVQDVWIIDFFFFFTVLSTKLMYLHINNKLNYFVMSLSFLDY